MATGKTTKHQWPVPAPADPAKMVGSDMRALGQAIDTSLPKITYGTGGPPTIGMVEGDLHFQYV